MQAFSFSTTKTIINEPGSAKRLGALCQQQGAKSVLLVTDAGIVKAGLLAQVLPSFAAVEVKVDVFDAVEPDPSDSTVLKAVHAASNIQADLIVGFGGGSSMDVAKLVAILSHPNCAQTLPDMYGVGNAQEPRLALIQVPTTAGTGSEVTPIAIVTTGETTKAGVVSAVLQPDITLLDAELTVGLPSHVTAATGIDAMVHAIEAYTSVHKKNPLSDMLAKEALRLLSRNILTAVRIGSDLQGRGNMLLGALLAGQAFANAPVAAVHALAYPLGGHFHIPHGLSNSLVLPHVMRFNAPSAKSLYAELAPIIMAEEYVAGSDEDVTLRLINWIETLIAKVGLPNRLRDCNVPEDFIGTLARDAMLQQRLLVNNPRQVTEQDALAIYQAAF
jgi:alcohol dehydrogenase class IV